MMADRLGDIVTADLTGIELETNELTELWDAISEDNDFSDLVGEAIVDTLVAGDGALKITVDAKLTEYPIIEFFSGEQVDYRETRGRLQEVVFYTDYTVKDRDYRLEELFGRGLYRIPALEFGREGSSPGHSAGAGRTGRCRLILATSSWLCR